MLRDLRQEGVEAQDELSMAFEQLLHAHDDSGCVDPGGSQPAPQIGTHKSDNVRSPFSSNNAYEACLPKLATMSDLLHPQLTAGL
jgi:hypothetical protein